MAAPVIPHAPVELLTVDGRDLALDPTSEILAKKLMYRADGFKARDVFDMATALSLDRDAAMAALRATARTRAALQVRLAAMAEVPTATLLAGIVPTASGRRHADGMVGRLSAALAEVEA